MPNTVRPQATELLVAPDECRSHRFREVPFIFIAIFWLGLLLGVSFLATIVKFQAPSLDLPTALDVGRVTFALLSKVEWVLCGLLIAAAFLSPLSQAVRLAGCGALVAVLALQALWLLPVLDSRVSQIIAGAAVPASNHHLYYVATEGVKTLLLLALSVEALWSSVASRRPG
jgi:hypothetical protein